VNSNPDQAPISKFFPDHREERVCWLTCDQKCQHHDDVHQYSAHNTSDNAESDAYEECSVEHNPTIGYDWYRS
jgi:hypothetical protein